MTFDNEKKTVTINGKEYEAREATDEEKQKIFVSRWKTF